MPKPSKRSESPPPARLLLEEAAHWFVLLASGEASDDERHRWQRWRQAHPDHEQAWQRAAGSCARFAQIPPEQAVASLRALDQANGLKSTRRRQTFGQLAVLLGAGIAGWQGYLASDCSADLRTAVGEQRATTLADGSQLQLDTDSAVDVDFSATTRLIRLRRGQIMVATAPDPAASARRFMVETAQGRVIALGTRFSVRQEAASTRVTVLEARVVLQGLNSAEDGPILGAGQSARFDRDGLVEQHQAPPADSAWVQGLLIANDMRLADLLEELARYHPEPLACDPAAAELRISGVFPLRERERTLAALADTLPIEFDRPAVGSGRPGLRVLRK